MYDRFSFPVLKAAVLTTSRYSYVVGSFRSSTSTKLFAYLSQSARARGRANTIFVPVKARSNPQQELLAKL